MDTNNKQKQKYYPSLLEVIFLPEEDVIRTSYVDDNYGGWDDDDAKPTGLGNN